MRRARPTETAYAVELTITTIRTATHGAWQGPKKHVVYCEGRTKTEAFAVARSDAAKYSAEPDVLSAIIGNKALTITRPI